MVALVHTVNTENLKEGEEPLAKGEYSLKVKECLTQKTKAETGTMIVVVCDVLGEASGVTIRFNYWNDNPKAQEIGQKQFDQFLNACGVSTIKNTDQVVGLKFNAFNEPKEREYTQDGETKTAVNNNWKKFSKFTGVQPAPEPAKQAEAKPATATPATNAWE